MCGRWDAIVSCCGIAWWMAKSDNLHMAKCLMLPHLTNRHSSIVPRTTLDGRNKSLERFVREGVVVVGQAGRGERYARQVWEMQILILFLYSTYTFILIEDLREPTARYPSQINDAIFSSFIPEQQEDNECP